MPSVLKIDIQESATDLKALMDEQRDALNRTKVQILWWLKTEQATQVAQLAQMSGYHRGSISRWLSQYRQGGLSAMLERRMSSGRPCVITGEVLEALKHELEKPEGFKSYGEIQQWLATTYGQHVPYKTVHRTVYYRLKTKLHTPRRRDGVGNA